jgi:hypothetical protein
MDRKLSYTWEMHGSSCALANPNGGSFELRVASTPVERLWVASVNSQEIEANFNTMLSAQLAAEDAYDSYYCDFETPTSGW